MDITPLLNDCLLQRQATPIPVYTFSVHTLNKFLQEAYNINYRINDLAKYLRAIRPSYLTLQTNRVFSTRRPNARDTRTPGQHQLSDNDRLRIDHETKTVLTTLATAIKELADTAALDASLAASIAAKKRSRKAFGALGRWAAGAGGQSSDLSPEEQAEERERNTLRVFRENVIWLLQRQIEGASEMQRSMVEVRLERERERSKSSLYRAQGPSTHGLINGIGVSGLSGGSGSSSGFDSGISKVSGAELQAEQEEVQTGARGNNGAELTAEQRQIFQKEEQDMLKQYNDELNKIKSAESSLLEISSLQSQLAMNLETQSAHIDQLVQDSELTTENVGMGNKELKKASERPSTARMVFYASCAYCATLVVWDWFI